MTMRDERTYIRVHDGMPDHPKIDGLSDPAFRLLVTMWCWCSRHLTDGKVPEATWNKRSSRKIRQELIEKGLAVVTPTGVEMHDYLQHQRSADEVAEMREKRRTAGALGGKAKAANLAGKVASAKASASDLLKQMPSKNVAELETERDTDKEQLQEELSAKKRAESASFDEFWNAYPIKAAKPAALTAYARAIKRASPAEILTGAINYRDDPNRDQGFTAHASTWLNQDRWNDPPKPPRTNRSTTQTATEKATDWLELAGLTPETQRAIGGRP